VTDNSEEQDHNDPQETEDQIEEAYKCSCGQVFPIENMKEFRSHLMRGSLADGKGTHKSLGRVDVSTGEIVSPPSKRPFINSEKTGARNNEDPTNNGNNQDPANKGKKQKGDPGGVAKHPSEAQVIRVVPKVYTMDYSPIMRAAQDAAVEYWGWRPDMPLGNFLDTCLHMFFEEKGIILCGYIVDESLLQKEEQHAS